MLYVIILLPLFAFIIFYPEIFPRCGCCGKTKFITRFLFHTCINMKLSRKGNQSICKKCCSSNGIVSLAHFRKMYEIRKRMEYMTKWQL